MGDMEQKKKFRDYITRGGDIQGPYGHIIGIEQGSPVIVSKPGSPVLSTKN